MVFILEQFIDLLKQFPLCSSDEDIEKMRKPMREYLRFLLSPNTHIEHKFIIPLITNKTTIESVCFALDINYYETILKVSKKNDFLKSMCTYTPVLPIIDLQKCFQTNRYITSFSLDLCCSMLEVMNCSKQYRNNLNQILKDNINENYLCINPHVYFLTTYLSPVESKKMDFCGN